MVAILRFGGLGCHHYGLDLWYDVLKVWPVAQVGTYLHIKPVVTVIVSFLVLGEKITLAGVLGGMVMLLGVWLVNRTI